MSVVGIVRHEFMAPGLSTPVTSSQCPAPAGGNLLVFELKSFHFGNFFAQSGYLLLPHAKNILILLQMRCLIRQSAIDSALINSPFREKIGPGVT